MWAGGGGEGGGGGGGRMKELGRGALNLRYGTDVRLEFYDPTCLYILQISIYIYLFIYLFANVILFINYYEDIMTIHIFHVFSREARV